MTSLIEEAEELIRIHEAITIEERFWLRVMKTDTCWIWNGWSGNKNYGRMSIYDKGKMKNIPTLAHRVSWELHNGKIPHGIHVLHKCDNPPCVNPDHLFLGTHKDNMMDMSKKGRHRSRYVKDPLFSCRKNK